MKKWILTLVLFTSAQAIAGAGYIATNAKVTRISSTSQNADAFWVHYTSAATDNCAGTVKFLLTNAGTAGVFERSFALLTTALVAGKRVDFYSYTNDTDCNSPVSVNLRN